jgi:antirestriction protein ArdC
VAKGFVAPIWMAFRQALELGGNVRKGEKGSLVVYADRIRRTETDADTGEDVNREIPFLKGYTVFCVDQIEGLPERFYGKTEPRLILVQLFEHAEIPPTGGMAMPCERILFASPRCAG